MYMLDNIGNEICPKCGCKVEGGYCDCFNTIRVDVNMTKTEEIISNELYGECPYSIYRIIYKNDDCEYAMALNKSDAAYQQFKKLANLIGLKVNNDMFEEYKKGIKNIIKVK